MENDYRVNWPVPDEFLIEIGRIAALWASLESLLNTCIGKLAGFNEVGDSTPFILITHSSFPQRLDMLSALCEELKSEHPHLSSHKEVVAKLKSAQTARNRYAHNGIVHDPETDAYVLPQASARGKVKFTIEPLTVQEVHNAAKEVHLAMLSLYKLVLKREMKPVWERP
jgi:hypothetical protein